MALFISLAKTRSREAERAPPQLPRARRLDDLLQPPHLHARIKSVYAYLMSRAATTLPTTYTSTRPLHTVLEQPATAAAERQNQSWQHGEVAFWSMQPRGCPGAMARAGLPLTQLPSAFPGEKKKEL